MSARTPFDVAIADRAAEISARAEKRLRELERRHRPIHDSPEFRQLCDRLANLRPVRVCLTVALRRGHRAYTTVVNGVPVAFTEKGWFTQEMVDAKLAAQGRTHVAPGSPSSTNT